MTSVQALYSVVQNMSTMLVEIGNAFSTASSKNNGMAPLRAMPETTAVTQIPIRAPSGLSRPPIDGYKVGACNICTSS